MLRMQISRTWASAAVVALAVTAAMAVVAMAARAPLSRSTPVNAASAQAPTVALFMLLLGVGTVMLGALAVLVWSGRRRKDDPPELVPEPLEVPWFWKLLAILLPLALAAALIAAVLSGSRTRHNSPSFAGGAGLGLTLGRGATKLGPSGFVLPGWLPWTALALALVMIAAGALFLLLRHRADKGPSSTAAARAAVQAAIDAIDTHMDARLAVIAAYAAMERTLADHGTARSPAEAPREFLRRALLASRATEREATTLTVLFEEARFSTHPIPERMRAVASSALNSLRARLGVNEAG